MKLSLSKVLIIAVVFVVGFVLGMFTAHAPVDLKDFSFEDITSKKEATNETNSQNNQTQKEQGTEQSSQSSGTTVVPTNSLTPSQIKMLESFGLDPNAITITPQMIICAEGKLGSARIEEIKNGATPSFLESASLLACYSN